MQTVLSSLGQFVRSIRAMWVHRSMHRFSFPFKQHDGHDGTSGSLSSLGFASLMLHSELTAVDFFSPTDSFLENALGEAILVKIAAEEEFVSMIDDGDEFGWI